MTEQPSPAAAAAPAEGPSTPATARSRTRPSPRQWAILAAAIACGLVVGGGIGAGAVAALSDPLQTNEYLALEDQFKDATSKIDETRRQAAAVEAAAQRAAAAQAQREAELELREQAASAKEAAVVAREQAVTAVEQQIAANSIGEGTWTVGRDVEPGTYRAAEAVTGRCYWGIYRSGSNGSDIIDNDIVTGGFPTVQLREGQDFTNRDCGTFVKQ